MPLAAVVGRAARTIERAPAASAQSTVGHRTVTCGRDTGRLPPKEPSVTMNTLQGRWLPHGTPSPLDKAITDKADLCAAALVEARRLSALAMFGGGHAQLEQRIEEMLGDLDEMLRQLDPDSHRAADERVAELRIGYAELLTRRDQLGT